jgi:hypothetical protein
MRVSPAAVQFPPVPEALSVPPAPAALAAEARRIHAESVRYWTAFDTDAFFRRPASDVWAPADQVRHLTKSIRAVTRGLRSPRLLLLVRFGWHRGASRSLEPLRSDYHRALGAGARAGSFAPRALEAAEMNAEGRARIMAHHATAVTEFADALAHWPARALDRYQLPHPLLGKLSAREMALFTLLHNVHHVGVAERRRREQSEGPA